MHTFTLIHLPNVSTVQNGKMILVSSQSVMNYMNQVNDSVYFHFKMAKFDKKVQYFASLDITVGHLYCKTVVKYKMFSYLHLTMHSFTVKGVVQRYENSLSSCSMYEPV